MNRLLRLSWLILPILSLFAFESCTHLSTGRIPASQDGAHRVTSWKLKGRSSRNGAYQGRLEISANQKIALRMVDYEELRFQNLAVQEIWEGEVLRRDNDAFIVRYRLKKANTLAKVNESTRSDTDFKELETITAEYSFSADSKTTRFSTSVGDYSEALEPGTQETLPAISWMSQRSWIRIPDGDLSFGERAAYLTVLQPVMHWFQKQPALDPYRETRNFKERAHFVIWDPTDYDFYQSHPEKLRVANTRLDSISLAESYNRWLAYSPSLHQKALRFQQVTETNHINEVGLYSGAEVDGNKKLIAYTPDGDGALWSGIYLASQAMRYLETEDPSALEAVRKTLKGLFILMDISGNPSEFARTVMSVDEKVLQASTRWHRGSGPHKDLMWLDGGNNDMYKGIVLGFAWAYRVLPENEKSLIRELREHSGRVGALKIADRVNNRTIALGLTALSSRSLEARENFISRFKRVHGVEDFLDLDEGLYYQGIADWSGVNLNLITYLSLLTVAEDIEHGFRKIAHDDQVEKQVINPLRETLMNQWYTYHGVKRDFVFVAAHSFAYRNGTRGLGFKTYEDLDRSEREWKARKVWDFESKQWIWSLREFPIERAWADLSWDYSKTEGFELSAMPRLPWKSIKKRQPVEFHLQSNAMYPLFENHGLESNYAWKEAAFSYRGNVLKQKSIPGADYLFTYWMARYGKLISEKD